MKILVTGALGFVGQVVVQALLAAGYGVRAVVRPGKDRGSMPWQSPNLEVFEADLVTLAEDSPILQGVDAVIHLVASKSSDFDRAYQDTVVATQRLLAAMKHSQVWRLIAISSFSVYDYSALPDGARLDETTPLATNPALRDAYARTKLLQEEVVREFGAQPQAAVTILRPGMIYGPGALWNACQGTGAGPAWLLIGPSAQMPLTYVENCAAAMIAALQSTAAVGATLNIVDDDLPTRQAYTDALVRQGTWKPKVIPLPWGAFRGVAQAVWWGQQTLLRGRGKLPGLLIPARLEARLKPLTYTNGKAKQVLGWQPAYHWREAIERSFALSSN
ncbi:NAD-dependent epimerase/dehydratase family protein [Leptolyngbya sp. BL0902]|uniref:NAD-dependent epimerase/dehydratase family protein n=1 Tax=Leptolyngbya sp. BL0902 TaxID=1115757 RepID=UPI0018E6F4B3|nr:NAD-dependent epimerase/dehydratase family protein [Leptolyngbya sp. BL0902]